MVMKEVARVLRPGGTVCVLVPNRTLPDFSFYCNLFVKNKDKRFEFLEKLDRGRMTDNIKHAKSELEWSNLFSKAGLVVESHGMHLSKTVVQLWDVGLRPLFPVLYKMVSHIDKKSIAEIKKEWIDIFKLFLEPIAGLDGELTQGVEPAFHCFVLKKQG